MRRVISNFEKMMLTSALSRRELLRKSLAMGVAIPVGASLLAACGSDEPVVDTDDDAGSSGDDSSEDPDATEAEDASDSDSGAANERRGGTLSVGMSGSVENFDPHHQIQHDSIWVNSMIYSRLVWLNTDLELEPDLATSWDASDDGLEWRFELRDDVKFHNGRDMTAEDVVESINRLLDENEATPFATQIDMIDEVVAESDTEVVLHLTNPYGDLGLLMGMYFMRIIPIEAADSLTTEPVGTGPYKLKSHNVGERTVLERFEDYFDTDNQAFLDEIHYIAIAEETSRVTALTGDTIQLIMEISPTSIPIVENAPGLHMEQVVTGSYQPIIMQADQEPFTDVRVRQALKLVLDRSELLQAVIQGVGEEANDQPVAPIDPMYADIPIPERNIERAQELLAEAGYADGLQLELHTTSGRPNLMELALTMQEMAQDAGVEIEIVNHPVDNYWADIWMNRPFHISNWTARPMADQTLSVAYLENSEWNESNWSNERFEELVSMARQTTDEDERRELYAEAQNILSEEGASIIPYFMSVTGCWSDTVQGYKMHPLRWAEFHSTWLDGA